MGVLETLTMFVCSFTQQIFFSIFIGNFTVLVIIKWWGYNHEQDKHSLFFPGDYFLIEGDSQ